MSLLPLWPNASLPPLVHNKHCFVCELNRPNSSTQPSDTQAMWLMLCICTETQCRQRWLEEHIPDYIMGRTRSSSYSGLNLHIQYCVVDFFLLNVFHIETKPNLRLTCIIHFPLTNLPLPSVHDFWECPCFKWVSDPFWATNTLYPPHITRRKSYAFEGRSV